MSIHIARLACGGSCTERSVTPPSSWCCARSCSSCLRCCSLAEPTLVSREAVSAAGFAAGGPEGGGREGTWLPLETKQPIRLFFYVGEADSE